MKKIAILIFAVLTTISVSACTFGEKNNDSQSPVSTSDEISSDLSINENETSSVEDTTSNNNSTTSADVEDDVQEPDSEGGLEIEDETEITIEENQEAVGF